LICNECRKKALDFGGGVSLNNPGSGVDLRRTPPMPEHDLQDLALTIVAVASIRSLIFKFLKRLAREVESVAIDWIRAYKRIKAEKNKR
jgi:hypothetical protein